MNLLSVTLGTLIDRSLAEIRNQYEVGRPVVRAAALTPTTTTYTLNVSANVGNVIEWPDGELNLITEKSNDATPVYTVRRGYFGSQANSHTANEVGILDPTFTRRQASLGVQRSFTAIEAGKVWPRTTASFTPVDDPAATIEGRVIVELPAATVDVLAVRYGLDRVPGWQFIDNLPTATYTTGKVLLLPFGWDDAWDVSVTYQTPFRWSSYPAAPDEDDTVQLPEEAQFVPSCYATAYLMSGREYSRTELDRAEEQSRSEPVRGGASRATVRDAWATFYRKLDEARRADNLIPDRPYVEMLS